MTATSARQNQSAALTKPVTRAAVKNLLSVICLTHRAEPTKELEEIYWLGLSDLTTDQISKLALLVVRQTKFWPSPAVLREMVGLPTAEQVVESNALAGLSTLLKALRMFITWEPLKRDKWLEELSAQKDDPIRKTLIQFGNGNLECAINLICLHPALRRGDEEPEALGLELNAVQKLEQRWIAAWRNVNV